VAVAAVAATTLVQVDQDLVAAIVKCSLPSMKVMCWKLLWAVQDLAGQLGLVLALEVLDLVIWMMHHCCSVLLKLHHRQCLDNSIRPTPHS
jgi:hypothetical protein